MKTIFNRHWLAIVLACIVGVLTVLPQLHTISLMGDMFKGVYPINGSDDLYYQARVKDSLDGYVTLANPYLYEHKSSLAAPFWAPDFIVAVVAKILFNENIHHTLLLFDFIFPATLLLLTYLLLLYISNNKYIALTVSFFVHGGLLLDTFNRSPSPQINFIFFLTLYIFLWRAVTTNKWFYFLASGVNLGLLFYVYPYYWTYFYALLFLVIIPWWLYKKHDNFFVKLSSVGIMGLCIGIVYFVNLIKDSQSDTYLQTITRLGMIETRFPSGLTIIAISLFAVTIFCSVNFYKRKKIDIKDWFLIAGSLASVVSVNQHIITGKNLEFSSHYLLQSIFAATCLLVAAYVHIIQLVSKRNQFILGIGVLCVLFCAGLWFIYPTLNKQGYPTYREILWQSYQPVFDWLNKNSEKDSVVLAEADLSALIPIYTSNNVFYVDTANLHFVSDDEIYRRFIVAHWEEYIDDLYIRQHERELWRVYYINRFNHTSNINKVRSLLGLVPLQVDRLPDINIKYVANMSQQLHANGFKKASEYYRLDYIVTPIGKPLIMGDYDILVKDAVPVGEFLIYTVIK